MEEELVEAVHSEKCLYDVKHPDYMRIKLKELIWKRIAEALNLKDGNEAKKSWEKLRNNHRDTLRRQKNAKPRSGSGAVNVKPWRFEDQMAFLIPYMANRPSTTNIEDSNDKTQYTDEPSQSQRDNEEIDIEVTQGDEAESQIHTQEIDQSLTNKEEEAPTRKRHKRDALNDLLNKSVQEHQERVANRKKNRENLKNITNDLTISNVKHDPLFHFFMSMYESTKLLPARSQHTIKTGLFAMLSQDEVENLPQIQYPSRPGSNSVASYYSSYGLPPAPHNLSNTTDTEEQPPTNIYTEGASSDHGLLQLL